MPLAFRPHRVTVRPKASGKTAGRVRESVSHEDAVVTIRGQVTQESPTRAFERFGVEVSEPWLLLANAPKSITAPEALLAEGARVDWTSPSGKAMAFIIQKVQVTDVGQAADNTAVLMRAIDPGEE